jgi:hypothetical protein
MVKALARGRLQSCALRWLMVGVGHLAVTIRAVAQVDSDGDALLDVVDATGSAGSATASRLSKAPHLIPRTFVRGGSWRPFWVV